MLQDSSLCKAAIHDGAITNAGGVVQVAMRDGDSSYTGSTQNGVTTSRYVGWKMVCKNLNICKFFSLEIVLDGIYQSWF